MAFPFTSGRRTSSHSRIVRAALTMVLVGVMLSLASCDQRRSPEQLLIEPGSRDNPRLAARAKQLYLQNCAICHTETGQGEGRFFASDLEPKPSDLTRQSPQALDLDGLQKWIREGSDGAGRSKLCPSWGRTLTDEDTAALARYVFSLRDAKPAPADDQPDDEASGDG